MHIYCFKFQKVENIFNSVLNHSILTPIAFCGYILAKVSKASNIPDSFSSQHTRSGDRRVSSRKRNKLMQHNL